MREQPKDAHTRPRIGRFRLVRKLGSGGQGTVYRAEDPTLERTVAIKVIHAHSVCGDLGPGELPHEARMAARLQHPNIVSIYDVGHVRGRPYLVFEFVEGRTFRELLAAEGAMPAPRALALMRPVIAGMAHAHERGVLHLDLGPGNVLLGARDVPRIMDFGLARLTGTVRDTTATPVGTLLYMAPEQLEEHPPGPQVDVRALALILYELLTGRSAIASRSLCHAVREICERDIDLDVIGTAPELGPVAEFLRPALARDPQARYASAAAMLQAFDEALAARRRIEAVAGAPAARGTVEFLLRRMQRRKDFPALSRSLVEINRMTARESTATASQLANVVLRDFALTNRLLKLANSAFYGVLAGEVKSVSHAISLLGFEQLRVTANSLTLFSHIKDRTRSRALRELLVRSFVAGLIARHLARREHLDHAEEAFICGMFQTLGETLTMFYFGEEYADLLALAARGHLDRRDAAVQVLGCDFAALGAAVAREWRFPKLIVDAIAGLPDDGALEPPAGDGERLRDVAVLADALCEVLGRGAHGAAFAVLAPLHARFRASIDADPALLARIAHAALEKLDAHAAILGIHTRTSAWCEAARACLAAPSPAPADEGHGATAQPAAAAGR